MISIILSAGESKRLITKNNRIPKTFRTVAKDNIINHQIRKCLRYNHKKIFINILKKNLKFIPLIKKNFLKNIKFFVEKNPLGTAGGVGAMMKYLKKEKCVLIIYGDNLTNCNYSKMLNFHKSKKADLTIGYYLKKNPYYSGILATKGNKVISFKEKITKKNNNIYKINSGVYIININLINEIKKSKLFDFAKDAIPYFLLTNKKILSFNVGKVLTFDNKYLFQKNKKIYK